MLDGLTAKRQGFNLDVRLILTRVFEILRDIKGLGFGKQRHDLDFVRFVHHAKFERQPFRRGTIQREIQIVEQHLVRRRHEENQLIVLNPGGGGFWQREHPRSPEYPVVADELERPLNQVGGIIRRIQSGHGGAFGFVRRVRPENAPVCEIAQQFGRQSYFARGTAAIQHCGEFAFADDLHDLHSGHDSAEKTIQRRVARAQAFFQSRLRGEDGNDFVAVRFGLNAKRKLVASLQRHLSAVHLRMVRQEEA